MIELRQSTASQVIPLGPFVDSTDGNTEETGLTIANTDIKLWKAGATSLANKNSGGATHMANGLYYCTLDATDTNTLGPLKVYVHESGALWAVQECVVLTAWEYDQKYGTWGSQVIYGNPQSVTDGQNLVLPSGAVVADDALNGSMLLVTSGTGDEQSPQYIVDSVASTDAVVLSPGFGTQPDTSSFVLVIPAPPAPTTSLPGVNVTQISGDATAADNLEAAYDGTGYDVGGILTRLTGIEGATFNTSTDSLEAIRDRGDAAWTTGGGGADPARLQNTTIATLASQTSFALTAGSADDDAYNGMLIVVTDQSTATQKAVGTIQDYTGSTKTVTLDADPGIFTMAVGDTVDIIAVGAVTGLTTAQVADAVWDEALSGHTTAGTAGERMGRIPNAAAGGSGGLPTVDASNYVAGIQGTKNTLDDLNDIDGTSVTATTITISTAQEESLADVFLGRNIAGGSNGGRDVTSALRVLRNKSVSNAGTFTVYEEDDTTVAWTASVSTAAGDPITDFDPA